MKEARYWEALADDKVRCRLCPRQCVIKPGQEGFCRNKRNLSGRLAAHRFGEVSALALDPVEKKPLYHFFPGRMILSVGGVGCNLGCEFCQNYHLVEARVGTDQLTPAEVVAAAGKHGSFGIAYTYNEPYISFEFVLETAVLAREQGIKNVLVTNGYYNPEPLEELLPWIDAMNIDLKSIRDEFYKKLCQARVEPVQRTIARAAGSCLVEVTNLLVTGENDSDDDIRDLVDWVAGVSRDLPLHFSAYRPMYKLHNPSTPLERLRRAYELAREKLNYVYLGNVMLDVGQDSACPHCGAVLVERQGYRTRVRELKGNRCGSCQNQVHFINEVQ